MEAPLSVTGAFMLSLGYFEDCAHVGAELLTVTLSVTICPQNRAVRDLGWAWSSMHKALGATPSATQNSQKAAHAGFRLQESEPFYSHLADKQICGGSAEFKEPGARAHKDLTCPSPQVVSPSAYPMFSMTLESLKDWGSRLVLWVEYS